MPDFLKLITVSALVTIGSGAIAQDTTTPATEGETAAPTEQTTPAAETPAGTQTPVAEGEATADPIPRNMGEEVVDENAPGTTYVYKEFGAWELRCMRVEEGQKEPCQLFQLMKTKDGAAIAEINIITLPEGQQAAAGATIVTPVETLLTKQVTLAIDGGAKKRYPFTWCGQAGCYARVGFSNGDIASLKRGASATLSIVPVFAPDQTINVTMSLSGFTAGYTALQELTAK